MVDIWGLLYFSLLFVLAKAQIPPPRDETCDPVRFGRPDNQDCKDALARLPDWGMTVSEDDDWQMVREFVNIGSAPWMQASDNGHNNVRTPLVYTNGTCTVAIVIPNDNYNTGSMFVETRKLNAKADSLRNKCVENQASGGLFHGVHQWRGLDIEELPNIYICGIESEAERELDYLYDCITDANGDKLCNNDVLLEQDDPDWIRYIENVKISDPQQPVPKGAKQACSGSCLNPEDCDLGSDCLCASTKGMFLDSTWGQHSCTYVAGTAIALAAAAIQPSKVCRGRCLLGEDGTVEIEQPENQTNTTSSVDIPLTNLMSIFNTSSQIVSATTDYSKPFNYSDTNSSGLPPDFPPHSTSSQKSPTLICPCNCTYVSASCCLSRIVWEEPSKKIQMQPPPANATVVCDTVSGQWVPKPTSSGERKEDKNDFIGMGSVRWNLSAANSVKIPKLA